MVAEVSDRRRVAQRLVLDEASSAGRSRPRAVPPPLPSAAPLRSATPAPPPPLPFDQEPYVYNGPMSKTSRGATVIVVGGVVGALVIIGVLFAKLGESQVARTKAETEIQNLTTSFQDQQKQIATLEEQRKKLASDMVARDHEDQAQKNKAGALKDALAGAVVDGVGVESVDGKVRVTIADKALFDDTGAQLSDGGKALLGKLAGVVAKSEATLDVVARADAKKPPSAKALKALPKDAQLLPADAWTQSAAKASVVVRGLEGKLPSKRLLASGKGPGRGVEIVISP